MRRPCSWSLTTPSADISSAGCERCERAPRPRERAVPVPCPSPSFGLHCAGRPPLSGTSRPGMRALAIALLAAGVPAYGGASPLADSPREVSPEARPAFRTYTDRDGLPQNVVNAIAMDSRGYLWVGTQSGAAYYNGHRWVPV